MPIPVLVRRLERAYGPRRWRRSRLSALDQLVATILSQNTNDTNSGEAFRRLKAALPTWPQVLDAPLRDIERAIRIGGLAPTKARRIKRVLRLVRERYGRLSLEFLRTAPLDEARGALASLPGVGPKTVGCVLMFGFNRPVLPVDTHVHRVSMRLGLIGEGTSAARAHELLQEQVPDRLVYAFHVLMIAHGRQTCRARRPSCRACVLSDRCPWRATQRAAGAE
ncbi:MAG: endonuclease III [Planctomycetes bacterium]|nr:endonuclease III [Planctomycetota bacterium]